MKKQVLILSVYIALVGFGIFQHEPWRDEAHSWLSARDDSLWQMVKDVRYDPIPLLWRVILMPFAKAGLPYISMHVIHASVAILAVSLLLFFGNIPFLIKILFTFSYYMAYEYAVIARHYILTIVLLFSIASVYTKRFAKPLLYGTLVSLLFQTNFYSALPAGMLFLLYCVEVWKQKRCIGRNGVAVLLMGVVGVFTAISYIPNAQTVHQVLPDKAWEELLRIVNNAIASTIYVKIVPFHAFILTPIILIATVIVFLTFFLSMKKKKDILLLALTSFLWLLITDMFFFQGTLRHYGLFLVYLIFFMWISELKFHRVLNVCLYVLLLVSFGSTAYTYAMDYQYNFSGAEDMARYIKSNDLETNDIVLYSASDGEALLPYFDRTTFWYPQLEKQTRYHINDVRAFRLGWLSTDQVVVSARNRFGGDASVLYLLSSPVEERRTDFRLLHASRTKQFWGNDTEQFWLYTRSQ